MGRKRRTCGAHLCERETERDKKKERERERERERDDVEVRAFALIFQAARFERFLVGLVVVVVVVREQNVPRQGTTTFITFITTPTFVDCEGLELQQTFPAAAAAAAERFLREPNGRGQALPLD